MLAVLALAAATACSEAASEPTTVETEALIASATTWMPSDLTRGLQVDDATRQKIEAGVRALHASMLDLHERHGKAEDLEGAARAAYMADLQADIGALHEQHKALWESLDPAVREALASRFHERMDDHGDGTMKSLHERLRRMHGGDHGVARGHP
jgi:hypothetical protein